MSTLTEAGSNFPDTSAAFVDELALIGRSVFDSMQRSGPIRTKRLWQRRDRRTVYLRLSTRPLEQPTRFRAELARNIVNGALAPSAGGECQWIVACQGVA